MPKYHVALSFAGEDRAYVEQVANCLRADGVDVFYDMFEEADLWGKNLYTHLSDVYQNKAMFTVMFVSDSYRTKLWTNHERQSAQARAFAEHQEYILPAFFDESIAVPGLLRTTGYVSLKTKTPEQFASLVVQKLQKSGVRLARQFSYSEAAKADVDYRLVKGTDVGEIIRDLRSYTWGTQNPAVVRLLDLDWSRVNPDDAFVLGRNLYQCACGGERKAGAVLANLRRELAALPDERALDLLNGMLFEVYFNSAGEFRGEKLKERCLPQLLALQTVSKFVSSVGFIRRALEPYRSSLLFRPNTQPEVVTVDVTVRKTDPPTVGTFTVNGKDVLIEDSEHGDVETRLWRLSYREFTLKELRQQLSEAWGIPQEQLTLKCTPVLEARVKMRLPDGTTIVPPVKR